MNKIQESVKSPRIVLMVSRDRKTTNYSEWVEYELDKCGKEYGKQAYSVIRHQRAYVPRPVAPEDYTPVIVEADEDGSMENVLAPLTNVQLGRLREKAEERRFDEISKMSIAGPKLYAALWEDLSIDSRLAVRNHGDFPPVEERQDPLGLMHGVGQRNLVSSLESPFSHLSRVCDKKREP